MWQHRGIRLRILTKRQGEKFFKNQISYGKSIIFRCLAIFNKWINFFWQWKAAARKIIEENIRDMVEFQETRGQ